MKISLAFAFLFVACNLTSDPHSQGDVSVVSKKCQGAPGGAKRAVEPHFATLSKDSASGTPIFTFISIFYCSSNAYFNGTVRDTTLVIVSEQPKNYTVTGCACDIQFIFQFKGDDAAARKIRLIKFNADSIPVAP